MKVKVPKKSPKSHEARQAEVHHIEHQLQELSLPHEYLDRVRQALRDFAETGQGYTFTQKMPPVAMHVLLSTQAHITSHIRVSRL